MIFNKKCVNLVSYYTGFDYTVPDNEGWYTVTDDETTLFEELDNEEIVSFILYLEEYYTKQLEERVRIDKNVSTIKNSLDDWESNGLNDVLDLAIEKLATFDKILFMYGIGNITLLKFFNEELYGKIKRTIPDYISIEFNEFGKAKTGESLTRRLSAIIHSNLTEDLMLEYSNRKKNK